MQHLHCPHCKRNGKPSKPFQTQQALRSHITQCRWKDLGLPALHKRPAQLLLGEQPAQQRRVKPKLAQLEVADQAGLQAVQLLQERHEQPTGPQHFSAGDAVLGDAAGAEEEAGAEATGGVAGAFEEADAGVMVGAAGAFEDAEAVGAAAQSAGVSSVRAVCVPRLAREHLGFGASKQKQQASLWSTGDGADEVDSDAAGSRPALPHAQSAAQDKHSLSAMEQALVELARHTPVQPFNRFVKRMCELYPQLKDQVRFSTMAELDELLAQEFDDVEWELCTVVLKYEAKGLDGVLATHTKTVSYYLRKDIAAIYRDFVGQYDMSAIQLLLVFERDLAGKRVFSGLHNGDLLARKQGQVESTSPGSTAFLTLNYRDGTTTRDGKEFIPVSTGPAWLPRDRLYKMGALVPFMLLPVIDEEPSRGLTGSVLTEFRMVAQQKIMEAGLAQQKHLSFSGFTAVDLVGVERHFIPLPAAWLGDRKDHYSLLNIKQNAADLRFEVKKERFGELEADPPVPRTLKRQQQVVKAAKAADTKAEGLRLLDLRSASSVCDTPLANYNLTEPYELAFPCYLHTIQIGLAAHCISLSTANSVLSLLMLEHCEGDLQWQKHVKGKRLLDSLDAALGEVPPFHGVCLPSNGLRSSIITAEAMDNLLAMRPVALLSIADQVPRLEDLVLSITELLEVEGIYTRLEHTEDTLAELDEAVLRFQRGLQERFPEKGCNFPKFFMMTLLSLTIRELGSSMLPDTGRGEMHHKPFKWASQHTNQRGVRRF